ncbi:hypothetical protein OENOO_62049 [Oenococcus oeni ATCC BAA-1163]|uniref:HEPN/Toprim N-terminal domain-containing protein n=1 Tax=Oenococcus oeni ATCC BAA-1163 TaxID=379360 RepID=A0NK99_OENOE|nr:HEPN/Toprim-associated domain-containing protein [Oenococcus oeni]EAV39103.1 hypothetical protein OENOO_62049 [Oenococcus oeni ATCC BAA-1163]KDE87850.1 hypothetical protein EL27_00105 [Oenococcus oeni]
MGTEIDLNIKNLTISWGKIEIFDNYFWLFDNFIFQRKTNDNSFENQLALSTNLKNVKFRMDHLGWSLKETQAVFDSTLGNAQCKFDLVLNFNILKRVIQNADLNKLNNDYLRNKNYDYGFSDWLKNTIEQDPEYQALVNHYIDQLPNLTDSSNGAELNDNVLSSETDFHFGPEKELEINLEEFLRSLDPNIVLRIFCEKDSNSDLELNWFCYDLIANGWATEDEIKYIDPRFYRIEHNKLYGKLQRYAIVVDGVDDTIQGMDNWLKAKGIKVFRKDYIKMKRNNKFNCHYTAPTFIRNTIDHPENELNSFENEDLINSVNVMLHIIKINNSSC